MLLADSGGEEECSEDGVSMGGCKEVRQRGNGATVAEVNAAEDRRERRGYFFIFYFPGWVPHVVRGQKMMWRCPVSSQYLSNESKPARGLILGPGG